MCWRWCSQLVARAARAPAPISANGIQSPKTQPQSGGKRGGTLTVLNHDDFENIDPGIAYYSIDYEAVYATQRPLFSYKPNTFSATTPDMASAPGEISDGGKTVTVHIRHGVHFSPPVNREVTSADVAYAIERGANPNVANPYFEVYFSSLEGVEKAKGGPFPGITTPNKYTIVFHLSKPDGQIVLDALALPLSAAVPEEYAKRFDSRKPSEYGNYQVATGPYMFKNNSEGKVLGIGYQPGKSATLVRNPNWQASTDFRPAYLDQINISIGGDPTVIGRQVLEGSDMVQNDTPAAPIVQLAYEKFRSQLSISPGAGSHYIAVNNKQGPFANINVRKAFWAALDRVAMNKARGGSLVTDVMTHFLYPEIPGFEEAGGLQGPKVDYNEHPEGDAAVAEKYMKLAGYPSGKYTGGKTLQIVGATGEPDPQEAEIVNNTLKSLGFTTKLSLVDESVMYSQVLRSRRPKRSTSARTSPGAPTSPIRPSGARPDVQRQGHHPLGQQQLGPGEQPHDQRRDGKGRTAGGRRSPREGVGRDRPGNRRRRSGDPLRLGQGAQHRGPKTSPVWAISGTPASGTTASPR